MKTTKNTPNELPTNTQVAITTTMEALKKYGMSEMHLEVIKMHLDSIAKSSKMDILNAINNLK